MREHELHMNQKILQMREKEGLLLDKITDIKHDYNDKIATIRQEHAKQLLNIKQDYKDLDPNPKWDEAFTKKVQVKKSHIDFEIAVSNIVKEIGNITLASIGDIPAVVDILKSLTLSIYAGTQQNNESVAQMKCLVDEEGNETYLIVTMKHAERHRSFGLRHFMSGSTYNLNVLCDIKILKPLNKAAQIKCQQVMNDNVNELLNIVRDGNIFTK
jgi:hypothetical protein